MEQHDDPVLQILPLTAQLGQQLHPGEAADQQLRRLRHIDVGQQFTARLGLGQRPGGLVDPHAERRCPVQAQRPLVQRQPDARPHQWLGPQPQRQHETGVDQLLQLGGLGRQGDRQLFLEHPEGQLLLGTEVEVERTLGDPGPLQDLPDGRRGVAAFVENGRRRLQNGPPRADRALLSRHRVPPDLRGSSWVSWVAPCGHRAVGVQPPCGPSVALGLESGDVDHPWKKTVSSVS